MATITAGEEAVLRSFVGDEVLLSDLQSRYDRLEDFDEVVLEVLRHQLSEFVSDGSAVIVIDGITINNTENIRALRQQIKDFENNGGTGLEEPTTLGAQVRRLTRPPLR